MHDWVEGEQVRSYEAKLSPLFTRLRPPQPNGRKSEKNVWEKNQGLKPSWPVRKSPHLRGIVTPMPGKRRNRKLEVLVRDLSGYATTRPSDRRKAGEDNSRMVDQAR